MPTAAGPAATARTSLRGLLRDALRLDRTQSDPVVSARNSIGVAVPLAIGALAGNPAIGLAATVGALQVAFADRPGPYLLRTLRMLGVALAAAASSTVAVLASRSEAASVVLLFVLALVAGLLLSGGAAATQAGVAIAATALVLGHTPQPASVAVHVGLLVLAGGALQTVLAVAAWPLGRHRPERFALAALYRDLAAAAREQQGAAAGPPASDTLTAARQTLYGLGHDHGPSVEAYRVLLDEADRIRREIVVGVAAAERLAAAGDPIRGGLARGALAAIAGVLDEIAAALQDGRGADEQVFAAARSAVEHTLTRLDDAAGTRAELTRRATAARLRVLAGHVRAAVESTRTGASEGRRGEVDAPGASVLRDPVATVRANLTPDSAVLRHAVRLAVVVAGSDLVVRLLGIDRGYWVALTVLVVARPDFGSTLQRSVMRTIGTVLGLLVASELVHWLPDGSWTPVVLIAVFAFGMRLAGPGNVALSAVSLSGLVVILLSVQGTSPHDTLVERSLSTLAGGALAVFAVLALLPSWERTLVSGRLADLLHAYRDLVLAVAEPDPDRAIDRERLHDARTACRLARSNAQASVDRAAAEPVRGADQVELGRAVLAHTHRFIHAVLAVETVRRSLREAGTLPLLAPLLTGAADTLAELETALREHRAAAQTPDLRAIRDELAHALGERSGPEATVALEAADRIADSLATLAAEQRRQAREQPAAVASAG